MHYSLPTHCHLPLLPTRPHAPFTPPPHSIDKPQSQEPIKNSQSQITIDNTLKDKKENQPITNINKVTKKLSNYSSIKLSNFT